MLRQTFLCCALVLAACGGVEESPEPSSSPVPGQALIEIGTGVTDFTALADGDRLTVVTAPQTGGGLGFGQHVDVALRAKNLDDTKLRVTARIRGGGSTHADVTQEVNLVKDGDWSILAGLRAVITTSCFDIVDANLTLEVSVEDRGAKTASGSVNVLGPEACPREAG